jgi:hypothetical protein
MVEKKLPFYMILQSQLKSMLKSHLILLWKKDILFQFKDFPNYAEDEYMFVSDTPNYTLHPHENDKVFG